MAARESMLVDQLAKVAQGDRAAFSDLYQQTSRAVYGQCMQLLRDNDEANDVLQET